MSILSKSLLASAAVLFSSSMPAFSQSLAEQVIEEYFAQATQGGMSINPGIKTVSGKTVEWSDVVFTMPNDQGQMTWEFIRAEEIGDGKVSVSYPDVLPVAINGTGDVPEIEGSITLLEAEHIISGDANARRHDFSASTLAYQIAAKDKSFSMIAELSNAAAKQVLSGKDIRHSAGTMAASHMSVSYNMAQDDMVMAMQMAYADLKAEFDADIINEDNAEDMLNGKKDFAFSYSLGAGNTMTDIKQPDFSGILNSETGGTEGGISIIGGIFKLAANSNNTSYNLKLTDMPLPPFQAEIDLAAMTIVMPLKKADDVLPAKVAFNLTGVKASDTIWGMVDPTATLPRDAANLNIDLTANMKWLVDLVKMDKAKGNPAEVQDVTINDITLEVAGARLHGAGAATLDNSKFPPEPVGQIDIDLKGGIGLLDKLVALGLVPQEQGQMAKMMSGMFAVPGGDGTDHLTSKVEMKTGGSVLVNGQQVK